jgi:hypothetical protein
MRSMSSLFSSARHTLHPWCASSRPEERGGRRICRRVLGAVARDLLPPTRLAHGGARCSRHGSHAAGEARRSRRGSRAAELSRGRQISLPPADLARGGDRPPSVLGVEGRGGGEWTGDGENRTHRIPFLHNQWHGG